MTMGYGGVAWGALVVVPTDTNETLLLLLLTLRRANGGGCPLTEVARGCTYGFN